MNIAEQFLHEHIGHNQLIKNMEINLQWTLF